MAIDGRDGDSYVTVPFMGKTANFFPGSLRIASLTGASILPTFIIRQPDNTHKLIIERPFITENYQKREDFLVCNMANLVAIFERYIVQYPDHFAMTVKLLQDKQEMANTGTPLFNSVAEKI